MVNVHRRLVSPCSISALILTSCSLVACGSDDGGNSDGSGDNDPVSVGPDAGGDVSGLPDVLPGDTTTADTGGPVVDLPPCTSSADCRGGYVCEDNFCREACSDSDPCRGVQSICNSEAGLCGECDGDADCDNGRGCDRGLCNGGCTSDAACGAGNICVDGGCTPTLCTPGAVSCDGTFLIECDERGASSTSVNCADECVDDGFGCACVDNACTARLCTPGTGRCVGSGAQTCLPDGSGYASVVPCDGDETCIGGACLSASCEANSSTCSGNVVVACSGAGFPEPGQDCSATGTLCREEGGRAACQSPVCIPDSRRCSDSTSVAVCDSLGSSETVQPCEGTNICEAGVCVPPATTECATPSIECQLMEASSGPEGEALPLGYYVQCLGSASGGSWTVDRFNYSMASRPALSLATIQRQSASSVYIVADESGEYRVNLRITDASGAPGCEVAVDSVVVPEVVEPDNALRIEVTWSAVVPTGGAQADIDLHLLWNGSGTCWGSEAGDCHWKAKNPDWGVIGDTSDNPAMLEDDLNSGGPEVIQFNEPLAGELYTIGVHGYGDNGSGVATVTVNAYVGGILSYTRTRSIAKWEFWRVASYNAATEAFVTIDTIQTGTSSTLPTTLTCP